MWRSYYFNVHFCGGEVLDIFSQVFTGHLDIFCDLPILILELFSFFRFSFSQELVRVLLTVVIGPLLVISKYIPQYNTCLLKIYSKFLQIKILKTFIWLNLSFHFRFWVSCLIFQWFPQIPWLFQKIGIGDQLNQVSREWHTCLVTLALHVCYLIFLKESLPHLWLVPFSPRYLYFCSPIRLVRDF